MFIRSQILKRCQLQIGIRICELYAIYPKGRVQAKIWKLTKKVNSKIEPFLVGTNRFNSNDNSPLIDLVKRTGIEIV